MRNPSEFDVTVDDIARELENCTPQEREAILQLVQNVKNTIHKLRVTGDE